MDNPVQDLSVDIEMFRKGKDKPQSKKIGFPDNLDNPDPGNLYPDFDEKILTGSPRPFR